MVKKTFTLIELIVVIVVLGLLVSIIVPNTLSVKEKAIASEINTNMNILQTAVDTYGIDHNGGHPTNEEPTLFNPARIDFQLLYPDYIHKMPDIEKEKYWVDYTGKVWGSTLDAPSGVEYSGDSVQWDNVLTANSYQIYEVSDGMRSLSSLSDQKVKSVKTVNSFDALKMKRNETSTYLISAIDRYGLETAPVGLGYNGYPQTTDDGTIFPLKNAKEYYITTNAHKEVVWDGIKKSETKPEGTNIVYEFATSQNGKDYSDFTTDFKSLPHSQYLKVKINLVPNADKSQRPILNFFQITFHAYGDPIVFADTNTGIVKETNIEHFSGSSSDMGSGIQISNGNTVGTFTQDIGLGGLYKITHVNQSSEYEPSSSGTGSSYKMYKDPSSNNTYLLSCNGITTLYQTSLDGKNYSEPTTEVSSLPAGKYLRVTDMLCRTTPTERSPRIYGTTVELQDPAKENWITVDDMNLQFDAQSTAQWLSASIDQYVPANTRILYSYATSEDGNVWSPSKENIADTSKGRYLSVRIISQINKNALEEPEFLGIGLDIKHLDGSKETIKGVGDLSYAIQKATNSYYAATKQYPTVQQPTLTAPQKIDFNKIYPSYLNFRPTEEYLNYWVDFNGKVWISTLETPNGVQIQNNILQWEAVINADSYNIYALKDTSKLTGNLLGAEDNLELIGTTKKTTFPVTAGKTYVVSAVDSQKNSTAPVGVGYVAYVERMDITTSLNFSNSYPSMPVLNIKNSSIAIANASSFKVGEWVMLYGAYGTDKAGQYEFVKIKSVDTANNLIYPYTFPTTITDAKDVLLTKTLSNEGIIDIKSGVTISANNWNGSSGGLVVIKTKQLNLSGSINVDGKGYRGGTGFSGIPNTHGKTGESFNNGWNQNSNVNNYSGGAGGQTNMNDGWYVGGDGGGGANLNNGTDGYGSIGGKAYSTFFTTSFTRALFGSGGGGGGADNDVYKLNGTGGNGGGIVIIYADTITGSGTISSNGLQGTIGQKEQGSGGGGAGGTIVVVSSNVQSTSLQYLVNGGAAQYSLGYGDSTKHWSGAGSQGVVYKVNKADFPLK